MKTHSDAPMPLAASRSRLWFGLGTAVLAGSALTSARPALAAAAPKLDAPEGPASARHLDTGRSSRNAMKGFLSASEGGEGGEGGVDPQAAAEDPVAFGVSLAVIEAHYLAGLAAYQAGEQMSGAAMFAHGYSEIYAEMEALYLARGIEAFGPKLEEAIGLAAGGMDEARVEAAANAVLAALDEAAEKGPASEDAVRTAAGIIAEMLDRTASQYYIARNGGTPETFLDGYGFAMTSQRLCERHLDAIAARSPRLAEAIRTGLALSHEAFPTFQPVAEPGIEPGVFLAAATQIRFALNALH